MRPNFSNPNKKVLALTDITGITVSKFNDNVMVVHAKEVGHDYVISVGGETGNFVDELVARLYLACRDIGNKIEVNVKEAIQYNNTLKALQTKTLGFEKNPTGVEGTRFQRGSVLYA